MTHNANSPTIRTVVAGIERNAINYTADFGYTPFDGGYEVLFFRSGRPRRLAICTHQSDAEHIVAALKLANDAGAI